MAGVSVSDIAFPLSFTEANNHMAVTQRQCTNKAPATHNIWWLRSRGGNAERDQIVLGTNGSFGLNVVTGTRAVRPALWIFSTQSFLIALTG